MSKILALTKVFLKGSHMFNYNKGKDKNESSTGKKAFGAFGILIIILYIAGVFGFLSYSLITTLQEAGMHTLFLGGLLLGIAFLLIFQTIFSSINIFYFSKDIEYILPLPLKPYQILAAKFNALLITEYLMEIMFALTPLIVYGVLTSASAMFYVYGILILLVFPVIPAILAAFLIIVIMSFAKFTKNRDRFQLVTGILAIGLAIGMQFMFSGNSEITEEQMMQILANTENVVNTITKYFPTLGPTLEVLRNPMTIGGLISFIELLGITILAYIVFIALGNGLYLKGAIGNTENSTGKGKKISSSKDIKQSNIGVSYFIKEIKLLFRNPIYFMQCVLPIIFIPVVFIIIFIQSMSSGDQSMIALKTIATETDMYTPVFAFLVLGIIQFMYSFGFTTITAISRDGKNAIFMKQIPISLYTQFKYKMLPGIIFNVVQTVFLLVLLVYVFPNISLIYLPVLFIVSILFTILQNYLYLIVDLKRPKLNWDSEYAVVKQNMNMMYQFFILFATIGILVGLGFMINTTTLNVYIVLAMLSALLIAGIYVIDRYVYKNQEELFDKIV